MDQGALKRFTTELLVLSAAAMVVSVASTYWLYPWAGIPFPAPMPGRTLVVVLLIWAILRRRGESFSDFGLKRPAHIWVTVLLVLAFLAAKLFVVQPLADVVTGLLELPKADHGFFDHLHGNPLALLGWLTTAWLVGGFAEEFIFRGYLMKRVADVLGGRAVAWAIALVAQAVLFGAMHVYLGGAGIISAAFTAFFFGLFFLIAKRSLWPLVLVHGAWDSLAFVLIYFRGVPSTS